MDDNSNTDESPNTVESPNKHESSNFDKFTGTWELESSKQFDEYMKAVGIGQFKRTVASTLEYQVEVVISTSGDDLQIKTNAPLQTMTMKAKLNEKFIENTADGRSTETIFFMDGPTMVQEQKWNGKKSVIVREINTEGKLKMTMSMEDVTCEKTFVNKDDCNDSS